MNLPEPKIDRDCAMELWIEEHSDYAKEQIVLNNIGLIRIVLNSLNLNPFDEDLFATGILGLVEAINTFDIDKGFKFSTYAIPVIQNEILKLFHKKRIIPSFSLEELRSLKNGEEVSYLEAVSDDKHFEEDVVANIQFEEFKFILRERERMVILLRMEGKIQEEIAEICEISQACVSRIIKRVCKKFKEKFN